MHRTLAALLLTATAAQAEVPAVLADIGPVHALAAQVMAGLGEPGLIVAAGGDPHAFQLRPSGARALDAADLVFWIGPQLTPWLERLLEGSAARTVALGEAEGITPRPPLFGGDEHGDGHGEDEPAEAADEDHDHGDEDPHVWLDPQNGKAMLNAIAAALAEADPANAEAYRGNAARAAAELDALTARVAARLAPHRQAPLVVYHDAYAHFAARFGLTVVGALALGDAHESGAGGLSELRATVAAQGAACVFAEPQHDSAPVEALAADLQLKVGTLDPEGTTLEPGPGLYAALIEGLAEGIASCLER